MRSLNNSPRHWGLLNPKSNRENKTYVYTQVNELLRSGYDADSRPRNALSGQKGYSAFPKNLLHPDAVDEASAAGSKKSYVECVREMFGIATDWSRYKALCNAKVRKRTNRSVGVFEPSARVFCWIF